MREHRPGNEKPLHWVGSSKKDFLGFPEAVVDDIGYALHAFQKRSPSGIRTARSDVDLVAKRLKTAKDDYEARHGKEAD